MCLLRFIRNWGKRHRIARRKITHHGQLDRRPKKDIARIAEQHLTTLAQASAGFKEPFIFNMDEVGVYNSLIHFMHC